MTGAEGFEIRIEKNVSVKDCMELPLMVVYVAAGTPHITLRGREYTLEQEDIILINGMELHSAEAGPDGVLCTVRIDYGLISSVTGDNAVVFSLNSVDVPNRPYADLRELFRQLVYFELEEMDHSRCRKMSLLYELMDILLLYCTEKLSGDTDKDTKTFEDTGKLIRIYAYVNKHFRDSLSLRELADMMFTSASSLSRFFKKQTGIYYADYLNRVRLAHALVEMEDTDRSITRISMDCGFSSPSAFSKLFHERYGMAPQDYRKFRRSEAERKSTEEAEIRKIMEERLKEIRPDRSFSSASEEIAVSVQGGTPFRNPWNIVLDMSSLSALTRANVQFHFLNIAKDLHISYVKIWSVFAADLRIADGKNKGSYNYSMVDNVLDMIVENQIGVYFDFGSRPNVIIGSGENTLLSEENGIQFESRELWEDLFEDFIRHIVSRYGQDVVHSWIFDFCIDPTFRGDGDYYEDHDYDYQNVFTFAMNTIRRLIPGAKVGGPMGIPNSPKGELETFLKKCAQSGVYPDFVSALLFPYRPTDDGKSFHRNPDPDFEMRQLRSMKEMIHRICGKDIPVYVSDWNLSLSNRNVLNDSCARGAYFCRKAGSLMQYASLCSLWVASDWVSNYFDTGKILSGGGGLLSRDSIRKPAYYAMQFLGELQGSLLHQEPGLIVTMKNQKSLRAVCSNSVSFNAGYYQREEDKLTPEDLDLAISAGGPMSRELIITGLPEGWEYTVKVRSVNRNFGSIQDEWKRLGYENDLTRDDVKYLREISVPHLVMTKAKVKNGKLKIRILLDEQEFQMLHIFSKDER
ncbi:MAG: helix-turn-helix domain-containing protein [Blautia sp.]|nr:helix-turn-helix domain-containing protein [Blautia sp.]